MPGVRKGIRHHMISCFFNLLANHQIKQQTTHKASCQPGDYSEPLKFSSRVCVCMYDLRCSLYHSLRVVNVFEYIYAQKKSLTCTMSNAGVFVQFLAFSFCLANSHRMQVNFLHLFTEAFRNITNSCRSVNIMCGSTKTNFKQTKERYHFHSFY